MNFVYSDELCEYMRRKKMHTVVIEVVTCNNTEFEVSELHVHLVNDTRARFFKEKLAYGSIATEHGEVLIPRYKLIYSDTVKFGLKKVLWFDKFTYEGVKMMK